MVGHALGRGGGFMGKKDVGAEGRKDRKERLQRWFMGVVTGGGCSSRGEEEMEEEEEAKRGIRGS